MFLVDFITWLSICKQTPAYSEYIFELIKLSLSFSGRSSFRAFNLNFLSRSLEMQSHHKRQPSRCKTRLVQIFPCSKLFSKLIRTQKSLILDIDIHTQRGDFMALTVHEALSLKALERFKLVAGANGLNNKISRVGLIDHESTSVLKDIILPQEFLFSNMIMIKDHPEMMLEYIKVIIEAQAACFAIKTIFFDGYPDEVIEYANLHKFPLFTFDETFIEDIILEVDQSLNAYSQIAKLQGHVDNMIAAESDPLKVRSLALKLNKSFSNHFIVTTLTPHNDVASTTLTISTLNQVLGKKCWAMDYEDSILLISSFHPRTSGDSFDYMADYVMKALEACGLNFNEYTIGMSDPKTSLGLMGRAVLESRFAIEYAQMHDFSLSHFKELGIYKVLIPNANNPWFYSYYEDMIQKLISYDENHDTDLLYTAQIYVDCDTNIQKTSERLYQHVNTVRYRVKKIKEILDLNNYEGMMHESLAIAIHLYKLHNR